MSSLLLRTRRSLHLHILLRTTRAFSSTQKIKNIDDQQSDQNSKVWETKAAKEAKGGDPYKVFGSQNYDVGSLHLKTQRSETRLFKFLNFLAGLHSKTSLQPTRPPPNPRK